MFDAFRKAFATWGGKSAPPPKPELPAGALELREGSPAFHAFVARATLEQLASGAGHAHDHDHDHGDHGPSCDPLSHGMSHVADLLSFDPHREDWLALVERYLEHAGGEIERLLPTPEGNQRYASIEALRAYLLAKQGQVAEALSLLVAVGQASPVPYLDAWALDWLEQPGALEELPGDVVCQAVTFALIRLPEFRVLTVRQQPYVERWVALTRRWDYSDCSEDLIKGADMTVVGLLRKAGEFEEGLARVREILKLRPSWHAVVAEGLLLREKGESEEADAAFRRALEFQPEDCSARLEAGDMYVRRREWAKAKAWYDEANAIEKDHPWAEPSALWCAWRLRSGSLVPDEAFPQRLIELLRGGNQRAHMLLATLMPMSGFLPEPGDATANILRQVLEEEIDLSAVSSSVSDVEAPSNGVAFRLAARAKGQEADLQVTYANVASPDPRLPVTSIRYPLWKRQGERLVPAVEPPAPAVADAVAEIASKPWERDVSWADAGRLARRLGTERVEDLLACVVHPPAIEDPHAALGWVVRVQLTVAQALAQLDEGWEGSVRKDALLSLLHGPRDWSTEAAIHALSDLVTEERVYADEVGKAFETLAKAEPDSGHWGYARTLFGCWSELPHLFPQEAEELAQRAASYVDEDEE